MEERIQMPLIGDKAPAFRAITTQGEINFPEGYKGKWVILFRILISRLYALRNS